MHLRFYINVPTFLYLCTYLLITMYLPSICLPLPFIPMYIPFYIDVLTFLYLCTSLLFVYPYLSCTSLSTPLSTSTFPHFYVYVLTFYYLCTSLLFAYFSIPMHLPSLTFCYLCVLPFFKIPTLTDFLYQPLSLLPISYLFLSYYLSRSIYLYPLALSYFYSFQFKVFTSNYIFLLPMRVFLLAYLSAYHSIYLSFNRCTLRRENSKLMVLLGNLQT